MSTFGYKSRGRGGGRGGPRGGPRGRAASLGPTSHTSRRTSGPALGPSGPSLPLGPLIGTVNQVDLINLEKKYEEVEEAQIRDCSMLTSFNWLEGDNTSILVPGAPPTWTPLPKPEKLSEDSGFHFRDPNAARSPIHPIAPAVQALLKEHADFNGQEVDLFCCTSTLGNLLRFARGADKSCHFLVESVGNTVFFIRRENSPMELIPDVRGFEHSFPEAYTTWEASVKGSASHQRLLQYELDGLKCVVRFQCDGFLKDLAEGGQSTPTQEDDRSDLGVLLGGVRLPSTSTQPAPSAQLKLKDAGKKIPQAAIFDLKTRSARKMDQEVLADELPRLWLAQIPNFVLAWHNSGVFNQIDTCDVRAEIREWEKENRTHIAQLKGLISTIVSTVKKSAEKKLEVRCDGSGLLEMRKQEEGLEGVLPAEVEKRWLAGDGDLDTQDTSIDRLSDEEDRSDESDRSKDYTACSADGCGYCGMCSY